MLYTIYNIISSSNGSSKIGSTNFTNFCKKGKKSSGSGISFDFFGISRWWDVASISISSFCKIIYALGLFGMGITLDLSILLFSYIY